MVLPGQERAKAETYPSLKQSCTLSLAVPFVPIEPVSAQLIVEGKMERSHPTGPVPSNIMTGHSECHGAAS